MFEGFPGHLNRRQLLAGAWLVALIATAGSLYYSNGLGLYPCRLCWYQRILMYPQVVILGYATLANWNDVHRVVLPFVIPGALVASYHSALQLAPSVTCSVGGCGTIQLRVLGLTIPNQSLLAFLLIGTAMVVSWRRFRS